MKKTIVTASILINIFSLTSLYAKAPTAQIINDSGPVTSFKIFQNARKCTEETSLTHNFFSSFIKEEPVAIPANRLVTLSGFTDNDIAYCKDYIFSFRPKAHHRYALNFSISKTALRTCELSIKDLTTGQKVAYLNRRFSREFWTGRGSCTDRIAQNA